MRDLILRVNSTQFIVSIGIHMYIIRITHVSKIFATYSSVTSADCIWMAARNFPLNAAITPIGLFISPDLTFSSNCHKKYVIFVEMRYMLVEYELLSKPRIFAVDLSLIQPNLLILHCKRYLLLQ